MYSAARNTHRGYWGNLQAILAQVDAFLSSAFGQSTPRTFLHSGVTCGLPLWTITVLPGYTLRRNGTTSVRHLSTHLSNRSGRTVYVRTCTVFATLPPPRSTSCPSLPSLGHPAPDCQNRASGHPRVSPRWSATVAKLRPRLRNRCYEPSSRTAGTSRVFAARTNGRWKG